MGNLFDKLFEKHGLSQFQKNKLLHEFNVFIDLNKDGKLEWCDLNTARDKICRMSGWKSGSTNFIQAHETFAEIWRNLQDTADENVDGIVTPDEWINMWQKIKIQYIKTQQEQEKLKKLPDWVDKYVDYKFKLYDRTGDGKIDIEEFEYVLSDFGTSSKEAKAAFIMFTENQTIPVNLDYFRELYRDYFMSDNPSDLGNFVTGRLSFGT